MDVKQSTIFSIIALILGFMLAIQFQTTQQPITRDTRDVWELREDIAKEQKLQANLINEIQKYNSLIRKYESKRETIKQRALMEQKENLRKKVGLAEVSGQGIILTVEPLMSEYIIGHTVTTVTPDLLFRLINELNFNGAEAISVAGQRIISTTPIRDVNGQTYINNSRLKPLPIQIKVLAEDAQRLHNHMIVSQSIDDFAIENLKLSSTPINYVTLPAYEEPLTTDLMEPINAQ